MAASCGQACPHLSSSSSARYEALEPLCLLVHMPFADGSPPVSNGCRPLLSSEDPSNKQWPGFSFDWKRGGDPGSTKKEQSSVPFLSSFSSYSEGLPFTSRQRWKHFTALLLLSALMFVLAGAFLPLVLLRPQKFCLFFTLGSMLSMASFAVLRGPLEQLKHMCSVQRCALSLPAHRPRSRAQRTPPSLSCPPRLLSSLLVSSLPLLHSSRAGCLSRART